MDVICCFIRTSRNEEKQSDVMTCKSIFILILATVCSTSGYPTHEPQVRIPDGEISGKYITTRNGRNISAFMGIPYAKPPLGKLRFRNPEPPESWDDSLRADKDPPICPQFKENGDFGGVEDCLFLNVYTPQVNPSKPFPVMVYIHGGAFVRGDATSAMIGPNYLLDFDVILVTMQYRLSVMGFLSTGDEFSSGNFGLKDQRLSLVWVQQNIKYFGGDPNQVTLFGESAGGVSVNFQVFSSSTKGLFHRYIAQSGSALCPWAFVESEQYRQYAFALGKLFNCSEDSSKELVDCLRNVPAPDLVKANPFSGMQGLVGVTWVPTNEPDIDGAFLSKTPIRAILDGSKQDLPNISGSVRDEGLLVTAQLYANQTLYDSLLGNLDHFLNFMTQSYMPKKNAVVVAKSIKNFYFEGVDEHNRTQVIKKLTDLVSDTAFLFPQELQLQLSAERSTSPHYYYTFEYRGTLSKTSMILKDNRNIGVAHTDDLNYLFQPRFNEFYLPKDVQMNDLDRKMINILTELWTSFASSGLPKTSYADDPYIWKPYHGTGSHLKFGEKADLTLKNEFLESRMRFWGTMILRLLIWSIG